MTTELFDKPVRQTYVVADLKCYMCGGVTGTIESEQTLKAVGGTPQPVLLRRPGESPAMRVLDWRRLRCDRCGGPLFLDETDVITRRTENYNWLDERPRRGRPPKRVVEERERQRALLDSQAA